MSAADRQLPYVDVDRGRIGHTGTVSVHRWAELTARLSSVGEKLVRSTASQFLIVLGLFVGLAGCSATYQPEQEEAAAPSFNLTNAVGECRNGYPNQITQAVERAACTIKA